MKKVKSYLVIFFLGLIITGVQLDHCAAQKTPQTRDRLFDDDWRFHRGDAPGAEQPAFADSDWRILDLPHDWSIEDLPENPREDQVGPFSKESPGKRNTGHVLGGTGWYRKTFTLEKSSQGKRVSILFDGVYMESTVWVNGRKAGYHPYGYTPFYYDITANLNPAGEENIIAVKVDNIGRNSRWYSGSGIYRHVWLTVAYPLHIAQWGVNITTPEVSAERAAININTTVQNDGQAAGDIQVMTTILNSAGKPVAKTEISAGVKAGDHTDVKQTLTVKKPQLWSLDSPTLYAVRVALKKGGTIVDQTTTPFGIRSIEFTLKKGFLLNGEPVLLKGGDMHHDNGPLGAAAIDRAEERRVELMKQFGFNAVRTSHNPPSQQFLDACDRLGLLVLDEAFDQWQRPKNPQDYHRFFDEWHERDMASMLRRDRNHPSIIMWSIGNEISERAEPHGLELSQELIDIVKRYDATRPATQAVCTFWEQPNKGKTWKDTEPIFAQLDVQGYNYQWQRYEEDHAAFPQRIMCGTESIAGEAFENWRQVEQHPYVIGDFVWTAMDYFGEAGIGHALYAVGDAGPQTPWPWFNAYCGDIDVCGFKKPQSYYRDVVWGRSNLEMAVHEPVPAGKKEIVSYWGWPNEEQSWNWPGAEGRTLSVNVYSNYPEVRLELNGAVIGEKEVTGETRLTATFEVPYEPGELKAIGLKDGQEVESKMLKTTGEATAIRLTADRDHIRANRNDLAYITVEIVDADGRRVPNATIPIEFDVDGAGDLAGVGNGNPTDMKSFQSPRCETFRGRCLVILRPTGEKGNIRLRATAKGLTAATIPVKVK